MKKRFPSLLSWLMAASPAFFFFTAQAHCPGKAPDETITHPEDGTAIVKVCYPDFSYCDTDTFYRADLQKELVARYQAAKHVAFGYVDSIRSFIRTDTQFFTPEVFYVDTSQRESVWVSFPGQIKGDLPKEQMVFEDSFTYVPEQPYATTYRSVIDTPFIAFFDTYGHIRELGIGPMDGCFFEPKAYLIFGGRVHKKGWGYMPNERMPGVSVAMEDFFKAVGLSGIAVPPVRPGKPGSIRSRGDQLAPWPGGVSGRRPWYDLKGRLMTGNPGRAGPSCGTCAGTSMGWYFLRAGVVGGTGNRELLRPQGVKADSGARMPYGKER